jgi:endo-1,4-beta-xylanase
LQVGRSPSKAAYAKVLQSYADLGVEVAITELDIRAKTPISPKEVEQQAKDFGNAIAACSSVKRCVGVTIWDFTDKFSWGKISSH